MAKVFPGGSTVTRVLPPSLVGGGVSVDAIDAAWYEEYFVDFTTQSTGAIAHNATISLGAQTGSGPAATWLAEEDDTSDDDNDEIGTLEWVSGSGLKTTPLETATNVHSAINAPCFSVALTDCIPNLTQNDVICVQVFCAEPVTMAANYDGYGFAIYKPETNLAAVRKWTALRNYYENGNRIWTVSGESGYNAPQTETGIATVPRMIEAVFYFNGGRAVFASSTSTSLTQTPLAASSNRGHVHSTALISVYGSYSPTWNLTAAGARLGLYALNVASATTWYNYVSAVRILRLAGRAGGAD